MEGNDSGVYENRFYKHRNFIYYSQNTKQDRQIRILGVYRKDTSKKKNNLEKHKDGTENSRKGELCQNFQLKYTETHLHQSGAKNK